MGRCRNFPAVSVQPSSLVLDPPPANERSSPSPPGSSRPRLSLCISQLLLLSLPSRLWPMLRHWGLSLGPAASGKLQAYQHRTQPQHIRNGNTALDTQASVPAPAQSPHSAFAPHPAPAPAPTLTPALTPAVTPAPALAAPLPNTLGYLYNHFSPENPRKSLLFSGPCPLFVQTSQCCYHHRSLVKTDQYCCRY